MNAALCQIVTAVPDEPACQQILEELERTNLFVVSPDEHRHWYRYHDLFREALLARLQARQPELVLLLHIRAADFYQAGQRDQARVVAARLFALTEPEGYLRVYLDEGEPMRQALSALHASAHPRKDEAPAEGEPVSATVAIARPYVLRLLAAYAQEEQKKKTALHHSSSKAPYASSVPGRVASASPAPVEPLTRRELEVLRWLSEGASNQQIAAALVIQLSTVKKHVGNLLAKLGAESRTQAIAQARAFSLL
jgi:LuxR family transcriptional regulator, maltose regulon positive regulatory protein